MNVETSVSGTTAVATVSGRVGLLPTRRTLTSPLRAIIDQGVSGLVVDCSGLKVHELGRVARAPDRHYGRPTPQVAGWLCAAFPTTSARFWK